MYTILQFCHANNAKESSQRSTSACHISVSRTFGLVVFLYEKHGYSIFRPDSDAR